MAMNILLASDSFKDALDAPGVCLALERGIRYAAPDANIRSFPLADGGEGTSEILTLNTGGQQVTCVVQDPLFRPIQANYGLSGNGQTAFIEMAKASGLQLLAVKERNPLFTTSFGTGELIADACRQGARKIILAIGGSATNDAGMGMAAALGYQFFDAAGHQLKPTGGNLARVKRIAGTRNAEIPEIEVEVLCDVDNPLYGPKGAAQVYAPQKGANPAAVTELDAGLAHFADVLRAWSGKSVAHQPGAGAAGGMGAGAMVFLNARLRPGIEAVMEYTGFEAALAWADLVVTGEGKIDGQTLHGKLISGIARRAAVHGIPVIALCGTLAATPAEVRDMGLTAAFPILNKPQSLEDAIAQTSVNLERTAAAVFSLMQIKYP